MLCPQLCPVAHRTRTPSTPGSGPKRRREAPETLVPQGLPGLCSVLKTGEATGPHPPPWRVKYLTLYAFRFSGKCQKSAQRAFVQTFRNHLVSRLVLQVLTFPAAPTRSVTHGNGETRVGLC